MSRRPYNRPVSKTTWWARNARYQNYMLREVTCIFIGAYMAALVIGLLRLSQGPEAWAGWVDWMLSPIGIIFQLLCLGFALVNTTSWFNVTPKAMPMTVGGEKVSGSVIVGAHYAAWAGLSLVVILIAGLL